MRVAEDHVLPPLDLEVLIHALTDHFDVAVRSPPELVDDQVRIVGTKVVEKHWDFETDRALQVALAVGGADKPACDVVVVTDFGDLSFALYKLVTADVAPSSIIILLLADTERFIARFVRRIATISASQTISVSRNSARAFSPTAITVR